MSPDREHTHPSGVDPDVADGHTAPLPPTPGHPELDGRARTAGQTWIGWRLQLLPGEVAAAGDPEVARRVRDADRRDRDALLGALRRGDRDERPAAERSAADSQHVDDGSDRP